MTYFWIIFIPVVAAISLTGSIFIIRHVYRRQATRKKMEAANSPATSEPSKIKSKPAMRDKLHAAAYSIGMLLLFIIARILHLPIPEIFFGTFFLLFSLFLLRHLFLWRKAKKLGCAIQVGRAPTAILAVFISFGILFGGVGAVLLHFDLAKQQRCNQFTQAVVVDYLRKYSTRSGNNSSSYYAVVEFDANGQSVRATSSIGWFDRRYKIGKELTIRYNPQNAHEFLIKGERRILPAAFIFFGLFFCAGIPILIFTQFDGKRLRQITAANKTAQMRF